LTVTAEDPDQDALTFSVEGNPAWLNLTQNGNHATLSGTPETTDKGIVHGIEISVTDGQYDTSLPKFDLRITPDGNAPGSTASLAQGAYNVPQTVTLSCSNDPDAVIYYTTDGSDPTDASDQYSKPIIIKATTQ